MVSEPEDMLCTALHCKAPALDVRVGPLVQIARGAEVDQLDGAPPRVLQQLSSSGSRSRSEVL